MNSLHERLSSPRTTSETKSTSDGRKSIKRSPASRRRQRPLRCESLEARRLLTTYLVDTLADTIDDTDGFVSLREALQAANTNAAVGNAAAGQPSSEAVDTIRFAPSLGNATITLGGTELVISESINIGRGDASSITINAGGLSRVFNVAAGAETTSIRDLTITGGSADIGGGLLLASSGRVTLDNVNVVGNTATGAAATQGGGGIYNQDTTLTILRGSIVGNVANGASGSGGGLFTSTGDVAIRETTIASNVANRAGGGIEIVTGTLLLTDVILGGRTPALGNIAGPSGSATPGNGGGLHVTGNPNISGTLVSVTGGQVLNNVAASEGGGLWNASSSSMTVTAGTLVSGNRAGGVTNTEGGGGIFNNGGLLVLSDTNIRNNVATGAAGGGGGVASDGGTVSIDHSLIAGNFAAGASGSGGGILALGTAQVNVVDTEISGNVASRAGGGIEIATTGSGRDALTLIGVQLSFNNAGVIDRDATAAAPGNGGGLHVTGSGNVFIADSLVNENVAANEGGGLWNGSGALTVETTRIERNFAFGAALDNGGGGIYNEGGVVVLNDSIVTRNEASGTAGSGGGILSVAGRVSLFDTMISANIANRAGGGIESAGGASIQLDGISLIDNIAGPVGSAAPGNGGGLHVTGTGNTSVVGGVVSGNFAAREGGGLWNDKGTLTVDGTTITGNTASGNAVDDGGGGIFNNGGNLQISNATITGNVAAASTSIALTGAQENPPVTTTSTGNAQFVYDSEDNQFSIDLFVTGIAVGNLTGAHLHVGNVGQNGPVIVNLNASNFVAEAGGARLRLNGVDFPADNVDELIAGGIYVNVHSVAKPGGEVRGQLVFPATMGSGGGVFNLGGTLSVTDSTISGNVASRAGGGIESNGGAVTLTGVNLVSNTAGPAGFATPGNGGGLHVTGTGNTSIVGGVVSGNFAAREGGGLWNDSGTLTVDGTTITRNVARGPAADDGGGGVFNNGGTLVISNATISANVADGLRGSGGGVFNLGGIATITDSSITGNVANRAGGGIESTAGSQTTLNNVNLDANNAGVASGGGVDNQPLLAYLFDELGRSAAATGTASVSGDPRLLFTDNSGNPADLHAGPGSGVSGRPGDLAFDNTTSSGITSASHGQNAADFDAIDGLSAFTLSGWFMLPGTATESIGRQDALIENGTISTLDAPGGFRLRGGAVANAGTLELRVNRDRVIESSRAYTEIGQYVFFAVSYDGTKTSDNVKFYKGTVGGGVTLVDTLTLNAGVVLQENIPLSIGVTRTSGLTLNPFNGLLDEIRIDGSVVSIGELESRRFAATGLSTSIAALPGNGGGLHISGDAIVRINDGSVSGNLAAGDGGGLWNSDTGNLIVDGTTISGNSASEGGGVYSLGGNTVLSNVNIVGNAASESGGGVYSEAGNSSFQNLTITDSVIDFNSAGAIDPGSGGGGIFAAGFSVVTNTDIINNTAIEGRADGGGVLAPAFSDFSTTGGTISGNRAARAGGGVENGGFFSSDGTDFDNNFAGVNGGALHQSGFGFTVVSDAMVTNNTAALEGGGFWNSDGGFMAVLDSTFDNNAAMFGGAIFGDGAFPDISVDRSVFTNNTATVNGGAIATEGGSLFLADNSFVGNTAGGNAPGLGGGAIFTAAANEISDTDLIGNSAASPMGNGGGILVAAGGTGTYFGGLIQGNVAGRAGGGLEVVGQITLDRDVINDTDLLIDANSAGINGGGLHISGSGNVTIRRAAVTNNTADGEGGGLWNSAAGTLIVNTTTVSGNVASGDAADQGGGGIYSDGGVVEINESDISNNLADGVSGSGGGILVNGGSLHVTDTSINGNIAVRAGGGIESVGAAVTILTDVNLDNNSAGLDRSLAGANVPAPLLLYNFNETGTTALATGTAADGSGNPVLNFNANNSTTPADLHSADGTGVSGAAGDRAFDNTGAGNQFSNVSHGQHAADFDAIDTLDAFTLSGWYMLPSTAQSIGLQDSLFENGSGNAGFRLRGGNRTNAGTLQLTVDGQTRETSRAYTEVGEYVYFAVSYDGTSTTDNVKFYKGTVGNGLTLVDTFSINAGSVNTETLPLFIGANRAFLAQFPFNGFLDNIRIDGSALPMESLEFLRADAVGQASGFRADPGNGGGLHISGPGDVTINRGTVSGNFAVNEGGGLWNSTSGTLTVVGTSVDDNVATGAPADSGGGGVYNDGGTVNLTNTDITRNVATGASGSGGGLLSVAGLVTVNNSRFTSNGANRAGGGIEIVAGTLSLTNSDLINNDVNGMATGGTALPGNGGGLHVSGIATVTIDNGIVSGNVAANEGGGLWNQAGSTLTVSNGTLIQLNTALGAGAANGGGGIFNNGGIVDVSDSIILSNFADGASGSGGGILNVRNGVVTVTDSDISLNVASRAGGGIEDNSVAAGTTATGNAITLTRVTLDRNNAGVITAGRGGALFSSPGNGGGLHVTGAGNVAIIQSTVSANVAANEGGGLWNSTGVMTIDASTIAGNSSGDGGGIFNDSATGDVVLTNSTISGNRATTTFPGIGGGNTTGSGGGLRSEGGNVTLTSTTVAMNTASVGGGLSAVAGTVTIGSSIVASNTGGNTDGAIVDAGNNVIGGTPGLAPLADNGGPTMTHALLVSSPALNNGNNVGLAVDQRGVTRPQGPASDSGAFESSLSGTLPFVARLGDVDGNGSVTALDALMVINFIGRSSGSAEGESTDADAANSSKLDVNGDGRVTALDALMVINSIGRAELSRDSGVVTDILPAADGLSPTDSVIKQRRRVIDDLLLEQLAIDALNARESR